MHAWHRIRTRWLMSAVVVTLCSAPLLAQTRSSGAASGSQPAATAVAGQHDFDWDIGTWKTQQKRLLHPLTGSTTWVEYHGTDVVRRIWDGANVGEIRADGLSRKNCRCHSQTAAILQISVVTIATRILHSAASRLPITGASDHLTPSQNYTGLSNRCTISKEPG